MDKVLVTGGCGFIGSHLVNYLANKGKKVVVLDNFAGGKANLKYIEKDAKIIRGSIESRNACRKALKGVDTVFHIAAHAAEGQSVFVPIFNAKTNLIGSITLLTEAINSRIEDFVFTSTIAVYGRPKKLPVNEEHPLQPEDPYGITKKAFEDYLRVYYELGRIKPYIVRFFNVFGPRQRLDDPYRGVVPIFINRIMQNKPPIIFGDGLQKRAFTYITDIIEPLYKIVGKKKLINNPINIGNTEVWSVKRLAETIIKKMGANLKPEFVPRRKSDVKVIYADITKAKKLLNYKPRVTINEGLDYTIEWALREGPKKFKYMDYFEIEKLAHSAYKKKQL
ncbi:MAG: GDP-mannose 4,6-dehydratase [Candidatus Diapherotrites archaeon]|nr:GDP-mannose 4,6-dehydratase [Candidatus Diapherotrites archaeon]